MNGAKSSSAWREQIEDGEHAGMSFDLFPTFLSIALRRR
jgi:hypothetical protein